MAEWRWGRDWGHRWRRGGWGQEGPCCAPRGAAALGPWRGRGQGGCTRVQGCSWGPAAAGGDPRGGWEGGAAAVQGDSMDLGASWLETLTPAPPPLHGPHQPPHSLPPAPFTPLRPPPPPLPCCPCKHLPPTHSPGISIPCGSGWPGARPVPAPAATRLALLMQGGQLHPRPRGSAASPPWPGSLGHRAGAMLGAPWIPTHGPRLRPGPQPPREAVRMCGESVWAWAGACAGGAKPAGCGVRQSLWPSVGLEGGAEAGDTVTAPLLQVNVLCGAGVLQVLLVIFLKRSSARKGTMGWLRAGPGPGPRHRKPLHTQPRHSQTPCTQTPSTATPCIPSTGTASPPSPSYPTHSATCRMDSWETKTWQAKRLSTGCLVMNPK